MHSLCIVYYIVMCRSRCRVLCFFKFLVLFFAMCDSEFFLPYSASSRMHLLHKSKELTYFLMPENILKRNMACLFCGLESWQKDITWQVFSYISLKRSHRNQIWGKCFQARHPAFLLKVLSSITCKECREKMSWRLQCSDCESLIICPIAIAYSMGQIIKSVCVCQCICQSVCPSASTLTVAFFDRFSPKLAQT